MRYINRATGAVIETGCSLSGGDWQAETEARPPARRSGRHKFDEENACKDSMAASEAEPHALEE